MSSNVFRIKMSHSTAKETWQTQLNAEGLQCAWKLQKKKKGSGGVLKQNKGKLKQRLLRTKQNNFTGNGQTDQEKNASGEASPRAVSQF